MIEASLNPARRDSLGRRFRDTLPPGLICGEAALVAVLIPMLLLHYPMIFVIGAVVGFLGVALVFSQPYWGLLVFLGLLYLRPEESFPALAGARMTLFVSLIA